MLFLAADTVQVFLEFLCHLFIGPLIQRQLQETLKSYFKVRVRRNVALSKHFFPINLFKESVLLDFLAAQPILRISVQQSPDQISGLFANVSWYLQSCMLNVIEQLIPRR